MCIKKTSIIAVAVMVLFMWVLVWGEDDVLVEEESVFLKELPELSFKPDVPLAFGTYKDGVLEGLYFLEYEEMPNVADRFVEKTSNFINAWVTLRKGEKDQKFEVVLVNLCFWHYDVEKMLKVARTLEFRSNEEVHGGKVVEVVQNGKNVVLQNEPFQLSPEEVNKVQPLAKKTISEFLGRFKSGQFVWDATSAAVDI